MIKTAVQYHDHSSYDRHEMGGHYLDWQNQPRVYKKYPGIDPIPLPRNVQLPEERLFSLLKKKIEGNGSARRIDLEDLSAILLLTCTLTAKTRHGGEDFYYRSVPSAGALYPTEIYVAVREIKGLDDGLYHFGIFHHDLTLIRSGDLTSHTALLIQPPVKRAYQVTFFMTAIFFRSAWKYRDRAYRYHLLDTGHLVEHLNLALKALRIPFGLSYDFDDKKVNHLLGLDETREVTLAVIPVSGGDLIPETEKKEIVELPDDMMKASRVSENEIPYPAINEIHAAGTGGSHAFTKGLDMTREIGVTAESWMEIPDFVPWPDVMNQREAIFHRRSRRNFVKTPIGKTAMMALLDALFDSDSMNSFQEAGYDRSVCPGFLAGHAVEFDPGFYLLETSKRAFGKVGSGTYTEMAAHICLDQAWLTQAAVQFLIISNLNLLDRTYGARGYRYAMLTAGRLGERLYLAATALGLGCCGIGALYDWEAAELLGLNQESRLLYLVAVGPVKGGLEVSGS
jgi:SagB-type dehydrogenase family enzyme